MITHNYRYEIYLCNTSYPYAIKACLTTTVVGFNIKRQMRNVDELSFTIFEKYKDGTTNADFDKIYSTNVIQVDTIINDVVDTTQLFHINNVNLKSNVVDNKEIKAYSLEFRMNQQSVKNFEYTCQIYTGTWDINDIPNSGIVDYLLTLFNSNWTVNYVTPALVGVYIDFNIPEAKVLEVVKIIEQNYNCVFIFNTDTQTIDIVEYNDTYNDFNTNTGIILDKANYVKEYNSQINTNEIITRLWIEGIDSTDVSGVNIIGTQYIDDFSFFMNAGYMTSGLITALQTVNGLRTTNASAYATLLSNLTTANGELTTLQSELADLESELIILQDKQDITLVTQASYLGKTYAQWGTDITAKEGEITSKEAEITSKQGEITTINGDITTLHTLVSYDTTLTSDQLKELSDYIQEETQRFDSDDEDVLLTLGQSYLDLKAQSQYEITVDLEDVFKINSESYAWDKIILGRTVNLIAGSQTFEPMIVEITHNVDSNTLSAIVSNKNYLSDDLSYLTSMWAKSNQSSIYVENRSTDWDDAKTQSDTATTFINSPIDVNTNVVDIGSTVTAVQQAQINRRGIYCRATDTSNDQLRIIGESIVITNDNWATSALAINSSGIKTSGSFQLLSETEYGGNSLVTIDGNGIKIYGTETEDQGLAIYNKTDTKVFNLDTSGNIVMTGSITITGGSGIGSLTDAGALATANDLDDVSDGSTYKKTNATEKAGAGYAYTGLNSSGVLVTRAIPAQNVAPSGAGLYLGADYMGYYDSATWKTYMDNSGNFYLGGTSGKLQWNGTTLSVSGNVVITGGSGISNLTDAGSLATLSAVGASNCDTTIISGGKVITGLLTADNIQAGTLTGRTIRTDTGLAGHYARIELTNSDVFAMYNSSNQKHGIYIDPNDSYVDFELWSNGSELFSVLTNVFNEVTFNCAGDTILYYGSDDVAYMKGDWAADTGTTFDVSNITYTGTKKIHVGTSAPSDTSGQTIWIDSN